MLRFRVGIYLHLVNRCLLIKFDQLKMLTAKNPSIPMIACIIPPRAEYQPYVTTQESRCVNFAKI
jgi:hypothetical protein